MKIIKKGRLPEESAWIGDCGHCGTVAEFEYYEIEEDGLIERMNYHMPCPLCDWSVELRRKEEPEVPEQVEDATHYAITEDGFILYSIIDYIMIWLPATKTWTRPNSVPHTLYRFEDKK